MNNSTMRSGVVSGVIFGLVFGFIGGWVQDIYLPAPGTNTNSQSGSEKVVQKVVAEESAVIAVAEEANPAVVSIIITKDLPVLEKVYVDPFGGNSPFSFRIPQYRQNGTEEQEIGGGSGFIVSEDGMILTNKHVVADTEANYTVLLNDGQRFAAQVLDRDPYGDLAVLQIKVAEKLPMLRLGNSDEIKVGQSVVAIGNALGEFRNTVSVGVVSGLSRTITASSQDGSTPEQLHDVIQTDAAINSGNSGGPLLNLSGEVIGINTAVSAQGQNIGFAIPINYAQADLESVKQYGEIIKPYVGVRYFPINKQSQAEFKLPVEQGAYIYDAGTDDEPSIVPGGPGEKAGLQEEDIITAVDGTALDADHDLAQIVRAHKPGDVLTFKVLRAGKELAVQVTLEKAPEEEQKKPEETAADE